MKRPAKYAVKTRHGTEAMTTSKEEALRLYRAEIKDGWPSYIRSLITGQRIK